MRASDPITADTLLTDMIEQYPETIQVFLQQRLYCVGCVISPFHTVADSAREHGLELRALLGDLNRAVLPLSGDPAS
jgi:hybrid cluster-associated redox disulfide protein